MLQLRPLTPGVAPLKPGVVFGRDTSTTARPLGIAHPQVSRVQGRTCAKPDGTLEVVALGIGRMRVVRADAASVKSSTMVQGQSCVMRAGDELRLLAVERRCACPLARPCACAESTGDRLQIVAADAEGKAQLALLWSLADLADWMRVTPGFCGMHGNAFGLRKHDGFSGVMGVLVGLLGCFKVYLKCR